MARTSYLSPRIGNSRWSINKHADLCFDYEHWSICYSYFSGLQGHKAIALDSFCARCQLAYGFMDQARLKRLNRSKAQFVAGLRCGRGYASAWRSHRVKVMSPPGL